MPFWKLELLKYKRSRSLKIMLFFVTLLVLFQSYTGYVTLEIPTKALYATGLDMLSMFVFPTLIPMILVLSFYMDKENDGYQNLLLRGITRKSIFGFQWIFYLIIFPCLFFLFFCLVLTFMGLRGGNILEILIGLLPYLLYTTIAIFSIVNISILLYELSNQNSMLPILIGLGGAIVGTFPFGDYFWLINPYSYLNHLFAFHSLKLIHILWLFLYCFLSFNGIIVYNIWKTSRNNENI